MASATALCANKAGDGARFRPDWTDSTAEERDDPQQENPCVQLVLLMMLKDEIVLCLRNAPMVSRSAALQRGGNT